MPLNPVVLGAAFVAGVAPTDALGIAGWTALGAPFVAWTISNVQVNPLGGAVPLIAAGPAVVGTGGLLPVGYQILGLQLAAAALTADVPGLEKWQKVAQHYSDTLTSFGGLDTSTLVAYIGPLPPVGPVAGTAKIKMSGDFDFATALDVQDDPGKAKWKAVGDALRQHLETFSLVVPAMTNTAGGGPLLGLGTIT